MIEICLISKDELVLTNTNPNEIMFKRDRNGDRYRLKFSINSLPSYMDALERLDINLSDSNVDSYYNDIISVMYHYGRDSLLNIMLGCLNEKFPLNTVEISNLGELKGRYSLTSDIVDRCLTVALTRMNLLDQYNSHISIDTNIHNVISIVGDGVFNRFKKKVAVAGSFVSLFYILFGVVGKLFNNFNELEIFYSSTKITDRTIDSGENDASEELVNKIRVLIARLSEKPEFANTMAIENVLGLFHTFNIYDRYFDIYSGYRIGDKIESTLASIGAKIRDELEQLNDTNIPDLKVNLKPLSMSSPQGSLDMMMNPDFNLNSKMIKEEKNGISVERPQLRPVVKSPKIIHALSIFPFLQLERENQYKYYYTPYYSFGMWNYRRKKFQIDPIFIENAKENCISALENLVDPHYYNRLIELAAMSFITASRDKNEEMMKEFEKLDVAIARYYYNWYKTGARVSVIQRNNSGVGAKDYLNKINFQIQILTLFYVEFMLFRGLRNQLNAKDINSSTFYQQKIRVSESIVKNISAIATEGYQEATSFIRDILGDIYDMVVEEDIREAYYSSYDSIRSLIENKKIPLVLPLLFDQYEIKSGFIREAMGRFNIRQRNEAGAFGETVMYNPYADVKIPLQTLGSFVFDGPKISIISESTLSIQQKKIRLSQEDFVGDE